LSAVGEPRQTETMLSKLPATLISDWLLMQGLQA
jgi:hypothetical protein